MNTTLERAKRDKRLSLESTQSFEEGAVFSMAPDGHLCVAVTDDQAVDSYNHTFTCHAHLSRKQARTLQDWLNAMLENG
jgi:hypothetical protein